MASEELQKAVDIKTINKTGAIDILHSIGKWNKLLLYHGQDLFIFHSMLVIDYF